ncbi:MAG: type II toxin-antitoxin system RelE/ParE family toxin [Chloroflexi bacterium]|nr:type II toxin-antitoxin system RelE/ParE family toxin [Chloroflexota bacterium]
MGYRIEVSPEVRKEIKALPGHVRTQARQLVRALGESPRPSRAKELRGKPNIYRIWLAGCWRIAYEVDDELQRIRVLRVRRKEGMDYESLETSE